MALKPEARFIISADDKSRNAIRSVQANLQGLKGRFGEIGQSLARYTGAIVGIAGPAGLGLLIKAQIDAADEAGKMAQRYGTTAEVLTATAFAAGQTGTSLDKIGISYRQLSKNINDFLSGTGEARQTIQDLNLQLTDNSGALRDVDDVMLDIADRFERLPDGVQKTAYAMRLFGESGAEIIPFLNQGAEGIRALREQAEELNLVVSTDAALAAAKFNDQLDVLKQTGTGFARDIAIEMLPALNEAVAAISAAHKEAGLLEAAWVALGAIGNAVFNDSLQKQIQDTEESIRNLEKATGRFSLLDPFNGFRIDYTDEIAELKAQLADLNAQQTAIDEQQRKSAEDRLKRLEEEQRKREEYAAALRKQAEERSAQEEAARQAETRARTLAAQAEAQRKAEADAIRGLELQIALVGKASEEERVLAEVRQGAYAGYSEATQTRLIELAREKDGVNELLEAEQERVRQQEKLAAEVSAIFESTRTPQEEYIAETQRLNELLDAGAFDEAAGGMETYWRAVQQAAERLPELNDQLEETRDSMSVFAEQAGRNIQDAFADFLFDPFDKGLKGMLESFAVTLRRMVAEAAAAQLLQSLGGATAGSTNPFGQAVNALFGGTRDSGGRGYPGMAYAIGISAQPEMFVPDSPGTFYPRGRGMGGGSNITVNQTLPRGSSAETRRSAGAGLRDAMAVVNRAARYA